MVDGVRQIGTLFSSRVRRRGCQCQFQRWQVHLLKLSTPFHQRKATLPFTLPSTLRYWRCANTWMPMFAAVVFYRCLACSLPFFLTPSTEYMYQAVPELWYILNHGDQATYHVEKCLKIINPPLPFLDGCRNRGINILYRFRIGFKPKHIGLHYPTSPYNILPAAHNVEMSQKANEDRAYRIAAEVFKAPVYYRSLAFAPEIIYGLTGCKTHLLYHHTDMLIGVLSSAKLITPNLS